MYSIEVLKAESADFFSFKILFDTEVMKVVSAACLHCFRWNSSKICRLFCMHCLRLKLRKSCLHYALLFHGNHESLGCCMLCLRWKSWKWCLLHVCVVWDGIMKVFSFLLMLYLWLKLWKSCLLYALPFQGNHESLGCFI